MIQTSLCASTQKWVSKLTNVMTWSQVVEQEKRTQDGGTVCENSCEGRNELKEEREKDVLGLTLKSEIGV